MGEKITSPWVLGVLLTATFTLISWNLISPITSSRSQEFMQFSKHEMLNEYDRNAVVQSYFHNPAASTVHLLRESLTENYTSYPDQTHGIHRIEDISHKTNETHYVTLTFYLEYGNHHDLPKLLDLLHQYQVKKALFFVHEEYSNDHPYMMSIISNKGYIIHEWKNLKYDSNYPPSRYHGITLADKEILKRSEKDIFAVDFLNDALYASKWNTVAFIPKIMKHEIVLEELLKQKDKGLEFVDHDFKTGFRLNHS